MPSKPITMTGDIEIIAGSVEGEKKSLPSFNVKAYTGGALQVNRWDWPVVVDLNGVQSAKSITANLHHDSSQIVGHVTGMEVKGSNLLLSGIVSGTGASAVEFLANGANGYPWQASIEAMPLRVVEIKSGEKVTVNGREFTGPIQVATKSRLYGVAFLPRGADENTSVSIAASAAKQGESNVEFNEWIKAAGMDPDQLNDVAKAFMKAKYDAEIAASSKVDENKKPIIAAPKFDVDDIRAAYSSHVADLELKLATHEPDIRDRAKFATIKAGAFKDANELRKKALSEEWSTEKLEVAAIKAAHKVELELIQAEAPAGPAIHSGTKDMSPDVIEAALCMTLRTPGHEKQFDEKTLEAAHKTFRRGVGLQQILIMAACANGAEIRAGERVSDGNLRSVLRFAMPDVHASGFSTVSLPGILSNVANKELLAGYMDEDQSWREIAAVKSVSDFKQVTSYRMLDNMIYEKLGAAGEIKHGTLGEESYTRQVDTYAKMFALTRRDIINDDLGAFEDLRTRLGRGAAIKFNDVFWTEFMSNASTFWTTALTNYIEGSTTNLGTDGVGLGLGVKAFRLMRSPSADGSKRIAGRPEILLVPPELESIADNLYQNRNLGQVKVADANIYANKYRPVVVPWLSDSNFTGYSTTAWYLLRNPAISAAVVVSFLNGMQTPTVESAEADFDTLGMQFRGYHDFGCDQAEYLCGVKSKGAA